MATPNVLLVCCDDLGYGDLGCYGAEYDTPSIDSLAADGVRCTDWHANAPVCSPTRASILTGQYPHAVEMPGNAPGGHPNADPDLGLPPDVPTVAEALSDAGYRTGQFGKWHLGMTERDDPLAHGFDECFGFRSGCVDYYSHCYVWGQAYGTPPYHDLWNDRDEVWHNGEYLTHMITDEAVSFVDGAAEGDEPFFAYVAYNAPHYPIHAPEEYFDRFPDLEGDRLRHAAMVAAVDDGVGALLEALERQGVADDTIVVFTSDHGPSREYRNHLDGAMRPYHGGRTGGFRGCKNSLFEGGIRVPGIVRYPAELDAGGVCDDLVCSMDLFPTLADYCDLSTPDELDGSNARSVLTGDANTSHDQVFWEQNGQIAVREDEWKLTVDAVEADPDPDTESGPYEQRAESPFLANLDEDPGETQNLAVDRPDLVERLEADAEQWLRRVGAA